MKYYQDITLLADAEANLGFLWHKVYQQVHLALAENKIADNQSAIAVSFPVYGDKKFPLGDKLRLFAESQTRLERLDIAAWLSRLIDYTQVKPIRSVPENITQHACFQRKQFKSNLIKEAARRAKYKNETLDEALEHFQHYQTECGLPYINMTSLSMKKNPDVSQNFKLFIELEIVDKPREERFNCYGLSKLATVPWF